nr:thermonuclease family protein [Ruegeria arenilitoris]
MRVLVGSRRQGNAKQTPRAHVPPRKTPDQSPWRSPAPERPDPKPTLRTITGKCYVIDGDTIVISKTKIRIAGIDAPELEHPWGKKSKYAVVQMCKGKVVTAVLKEDLSYDRLVAECFLPDGTDIAAELVRQGLALDWPKFSGGKYKHLEPEGVRKKLWRASARQQGRMKIFDK